MYNSSRERWRPESALERCVGQPSESSLCLLRVIQRDVMLRSSGSSSGQRFPFSPPGRSRWQEGVLLQGHPRPWPFAKLRTLWVPAHKVQGTKTDNAVLAFYLAFSLGGARASCHLRHSVPDKEAVHVRVAPVGGFLVLHSRAGSARRQRPGWRWNRQPRLCRLHSAVRLRRVYLYLPAIPPHLRRGEPRRKCSGRAGAAVPAAGAENVGQRFRRIVAAKTDSLVGTQSRLRFCPSSTAPVGTVFPGLRPRGVIPSIQRCHGPCRPGPRRPSVPTYCRSLPAAGSLGSPVRCTVKARHSPRADATDRLRGHAPLASLVPRHWWFVDSGPGARVQVLHIFNDITRSTDQAQRLQTTNANFLSTPWRWCG